MRATKNRARPDLPVELSEFSVAEAARLPETGELLLYERSLKGLNFAEVRLSRVTAESCVFEQVSLNHAVIGWMRCKDVAFINCDLANFQPRKFVGTRVEFRDCRLTGARFNESACSDLLIAGGDQKYAQFRFSEIELAEFESCSLEEADFYAARLKQVRFSNCRLLNVEMSGIKLTEVDLRGSVVDGLRLNAEDIRGAIVDPAQALTFAHLLGIRIA